MAPLVTKKSCLNCHAKQGYKEGDIRGAISITSPSIMKTQFFPLFVGHLFIGLVGLFGIVIIGGRLNNAYETIKRQAGFDALTGIPNRRSFTTTLLSEFKRSQRDQKSLSVIMCDVDNFKTYNDTYGHSSGDICLKKVAKMLKTSLKRPGDFCARYGGEEFVVLLPNTPLDGAIDIAERIRLNIEQMKISHEKSLPIKFVTLSLGVTASNGDTMVNSETLVKRADIGLYKAKEQGRNQVQSFSKNA